MKKQLGTIFLTAITTLLLSGCAVTGLDPQALMVPPNANANQQGIQKLLTGEKTDVTYVYPKNGDYRSAVIMQDFTGDGKEDALGFVLLETGGIEAVFLSQNEENEWKTVASFRNPATQVDRVCFGDLTGSGTQDVIIGWGNTQNNMSASMSVYSYDGGLVRERHAENTYGGMVLTDFDQDGIKEIFVMQRPVPAADETQESLPARAEWIRLEGEKLVSVVSAEADNSIVKYSSLQFGKITADQYAVVMDGSKADSSMTTQIFYMTEQGRLVNIPQGVNDESSVSPLYRPPGAGGTSRDINNDGIIEFPIVSFLPAVADPLAADSTSFLIDWSNLDFDSMIYKSKKKTLMNYTEKYGFVLPASFIGKITAINDAKLKAVTYYSVISKDESSNEGKDLIGSPLFTIRVFTTSAWEQRGQTGGYKKLAEKNDYVYGIAVLTSDNTYQAFISRIERDFQLDK